MQNALSFLAIAVQEFTPSQSSKDANLYIGCLFNTAFDGRRDNWG